MDLIFLGIGAVVGTGIFVVTGVAAERYAGPGLVLSFLVASRDYFIWFMLCRICITYSGHWWAVCLHVCGLWRNCGLDDWLDDYL